MIIKIEQFYGRPVYLAKHYNPLLSFGENHNQVLKTPTTLNSILQTTDLFCIAFHESDIVGFAHLSEAILAGAFVHPDYRRQGIFNTMTQMLITYAREILRIQKIIVNPGSDGAMEYFEKNGFTFLDNGTDIIGFREYN